MDKITRRGALGSVAGSLLIVEPKTAFGYQENSAVALGIIGTGNRGRYVSGIFAKDPRARVAAICDIEPLAIDAARKQVPGADHARTYRDYRELLASSGLDCILIATPIFLHPEHFEAAVDSRKHIYCEKAANADVAGVKRVMHAGERADKAVCSASASISLAENSAGAVAA